ncbi:MAG: hypothetical protein PHD79_04100 [Aliarcobacter sp.]|mgnify:FL=1|nr:hypothetical protein [Aliarcobacter sp.]
MITQVDKDSLFNTFGVKNFELLHSAIDNMAPSLVEYYLSSFTNDDELYFNKRDIEESISIGDYNLYIDYTKNIYLELNSTTEEITQSFW